MQNILSLFRGALSIILGILGILFFTMSLFSSFRHLEGIFVTKQTIRVITKYQALAGVAIFLAIVIYNPSIIWVAILGAIIYSGILFLSFTVSTWTISILQKK